MTDPTRPPPRAADAAPSPGPAPASALHAAFDHISDGIVVFDTAWRYVYVNERGGALLGRTPAELLGRGYLDVFPEAAGLPFHLAYARAVATGQASVFEEYYAPWDRWFENRIYPSDAGLVIVFADVTERRRAAVARDRGEQRLRMLLEASAQGVWWTGPHGEPIGDLPSGEAFTAPAAEQDRRDGWIEAVHPDDRERTLRAWRESLAAGVPFLAEHRVSRGDGEWRHMVARGIPLRNADGTVREWVGTHTDVTDRVQTERALRTAGHHLRRVVDTLPAGAAYVEGERITVNAAVEALTGHRGVELRTLDAWLGALFGARAAAMRARYDADRAAGFPKARRVWIAARGGERRLVEITARAADGLDVLVIHDVTARARAEGALRERELQLAEAQRIAAVGSWTWDFAAREARWTAELYRIFARDPGAGPPRGGELYEHVHPDDRAALRDRLARALAARDPQIETEFRVVHPGGRARRVVARAEVRYDAAGRAAVMAGTAQDVTERRQLEEQFRQAQKMEAVGQLAGGIAHDFNNLLTAIDANAELSLAAVREFDPAVAPPEAVLAAVAADLHEIRRAASRAADLTRQLLAFSRRQMLDARPVDLNRVVTEAMPMLRRLVSEHITVDTALAGAPGTVVVDPRQLEQVLMNLVVNARDAVRERAAPRITVATANLVVPAAEAWGTVDGGPDPRAALLPRGAVPVRTGLAAGRYTLLLVHDTGTGMDAETQAHIFEPFFTTKPVGEGTGLGLSTVYGIVKQSGGYVYADSTPGEGTLCTVYLPAAARPAQVEDAVARARAARDRATAAPSGSYEAVIADALPAIRPTPAGGAAAAVPAGGTVLLVEDEAPVRLALRRLLERAGHRVLEARNGSEALALWEQHRAAVGLVVTDVVMPELGGIALVERLRSERPELPVLFISGHSETAAPAHAPLGARTEWLTKPFKMTTIMRAVEELMAAGPPPEAK